MEDAPSPIDHRLVKLVGVSRPRICLFWNETSQSFSSSGCSSTGLTADHSALGCECSHLAFFRKPFRSSLPLSDYAGQLLEHDAIVVCGGNTKSALAVGREWRLDQVLRQAWSQGVLLSGMSAGAMCWFAHGLTDSFWGAGLKPLPCLGFLPNNCCVHYNGDPERRLRLHQALDNGVFEDALAIDDGAAILFGDRDIERVFS